jgi:hypothetical protein
VSTSELFINFLIVQNMCASLNLVISFIENVLVVKCDSGSTYCGQKRQATFKNDDINNNSSEKKNQIEIFKKPRKHQGILTDIDFFLLSGS